MAAVDLASLRRSATSRPPIPGIEMSSTITSGHNLRAASRAVGPSFALPTISHACERTIEARSRIAWLSSTRSTRGCSNNVVAHCVPNEFGCGLDIELLHHSVLVKGDRARCQVQQGGDLLHRVALGEQLQDLALPWRQFPGRRVLVDVEQRSDEPFGDERRHI